MDTNTMVTPAVDTKPHAATASTNGATASSNLPQKVVWSVNERNGRKIWTRVGAGWINRDGSMNLRLEALPIGNGTLQVRDYEPRDESTHGRDRDHGQPSSTQQQRSSFL